ncbi:prepilin peptidase [Magnetospira sp. QH-2]|uniref:A24 family peptidase n=1 Tax=Magnetospira sp. (strain QH-2) TaxID=1288970 RepID=UPI0003E816D1|nr:prepilin peptidase [Magnetospira sp. QH-2]CCQ73548.1 Putative pilus assembly protein CpaA [Magnetospira sp. QH-2]
MPISLTPDHILIVLFLSLVLVAAGQDVSRYRIPNWISVAIIGLYPFHAWLSAAPVPWGWSLMVAGIVFVAGFALFAFKVLGGGDVKLLVATSLWAGPAYIFDLLIFTALAGGVMAIVLVSRAKLVLAWAFDHAGWTGLRDKMMSDVLPYGLAIAVGSGVVALQLFQGGLS